MPPVVGRRYILKLRQSEFGQQSGGKCIERIPGGAAGAWSGQCMTPRSIPHRCPNLSQKRKNAGSNQGTLSGAGGTKHQNEALLGRRLFLQSVKHFADGLRSAVINSCMFEIKGF